MLLPNCRVIFRLILEQVVCTFDKDLSNVHPLYPWDPFYRRLGGHQGRSRRAENLVSSGIRSRTVQLVVSRYTD